MRLAVRVEAIEHLRLGQFRHDLAGRLIERQLAVLDHCMAATPVTALVIEAMRNTVSSVIGVSVGQAASAERALVDAPLRSAASATTPGTGPR